MGAALVVNNLAFLKKLTGSCQYDDEKLRDWWKSTDIKIYWNDSKTLRRFRLGKGCCGPTTVNKIFAFCGCRYNLQSLLDLILLVFNFDHPTAKLISDDGGLKEFWEPVTVAQILKETPDFFVTHSDSMDFDQYLIPLSADHQLQMGHLYFLLPREKLQNPLPSSEMAAMAVKAAAALQRQQNKKSRRKCSRCKIEPEMEYDMNGHQGLNYLKESPSFRATTIGDFSNLWKMKLSPIPEGFDC